ncbi:hypothetical protein M2263_001453 [Providencia alcalifaciens]|nr:hypothetical protein [Providencia alcalifaciens]
MPIYPVITPSNNSTLSVSSSQNEQSSSRTSRCHRQLVHNVRTVQTASDNKNININITKFFCTFLTSHKNQYKREWKKWIKEAPIEERAARQQAVSTLHRCMHSKEPSLNLSGLGLSSLPNLPPHITNLNLSLNKLKLFPNFLKA